MDETSAPIEIFCSYAHEDEPWLRKLETHLSLLKRQGLISLWHNRLITPGTDWEHALDTHLETASVILLLVSADFLASDYCYGIEMKRALARQEAGEARVVPILVRPTDWESAPFAHLHVLPTGARPLASWRDREKALADVAAGIRRVIEEGSQFPASTPRAALPRFCNVPYQHNPFFLGRENELVQMRSHLQAGQTMALAQRQAISGLGGIGKTQLAVEYAYRYQQDYQAVLWVHAASTETFISSYIAIAALLQLPESEAKEQAVVVQAVKTWLQTHSSWLLILDNVDELSLLPNFLPPSLGGHLLLTTRATATGPLAHRLEIETLKPEQGALLLLRRARLLPPDAPLQSASSQERELALHISQAFDGLPLALDQAGAYLEETRTDLASYWQIYQQHRTRLLQRRGNVVVDHPEPVATTWSLSFQKIEEKNPAAAELLRLCAFLAPDAIAEEILTEGASAFGPVLAPVAADAFLLNQAIEILLAYSLVRRDPGGKTLSIHRLVQAVLLDSLSEQEKVQWIERIITAMDQIFPRIMRQIFPSSSEDVQQENAAQSPFFQGERLVPHIFTSIKQVVSWTAIPQDLAYSLAHLLKALAFYLNVHPRPTEAISLYEQILRILKPDNLLSIFLIQEGLATLYQTKGKYREAELQLLSILQAAEPIPEALSSWKANLLNSLAICCQCQGRYEEAAQLLQRARLVRGEREAPPTLDEASSIYNQAIVLKNLGRYEEAERLHLQVLHLREQALGSNHPDVAVSLSSLAVLYQTQGRFSEAEPLFQRALQIKEQAFGPTHPEMVSPILNLANLYAVQGRLAEAEALYRRGLPIWEQALGLDHPDVALILRNLADACEMQGKHAEAEQLCQRALNIYEQTDHQDASIARILFATIRISRAKEKNER